MGSPLSSFLAEAVLQDLERKAVTNNNAIGIWDRYVDDVFSTVKTNHINDVLNTINHTTEGIAFTKEEEQNKQLAFLDVLVNRTIEGTFNTSVHRKDTHTNQILNYNSNHPTQHKASCVRTLYNCINTHCNTDQAKHDERTYLNATFSKNNYPKNFMRCIISQENNKPNNKTDTEKQDLRIATIPYIHSISELTARILRRYDIVIAHKPSNRLSTKFTKHKHKVPTNAKRNVIYTFSCNDCPAQYIGHTSKKLETRLTEHSNAIKRHDTLSLPSNHADEHTHTFNFAHKKILGQATSKHAREFIEAWYSINKSSFNRHIDIPPIYLQIKSECDKDPHRRNPETSQQQSTHTTDLLPRNPTPPHRDACNLTTRDQPIRRSKRIQERKTNAQNSKP